jgi:hypothetical protein
MYFKFKIFTQFCNFTISLIGTSQMYSNVQQQSRIYPLELEDDTFCFQGLKPKTSYKIIVQKNKTIIEGAVRTTEMYSYQVHTLGIDVHVSKVLNLLSLLPLLVIIPIAIVFRKHFLAKSVSYPFVNFTKIVCNLLL